MRIIVMYKIGVIGLGYVGLPLAHAFAKKFKVVGFDIDDVRIAELQSKKDRTRELSNSEIAEFFTNGGKVSSRICLF